MANRAEYKKARAVADALLAEHGKLMFADDSHDGAAHCGCDLAKKYQEADAEAWRIREKAPKTAEEKLMAWFEDAIDKFCETHSDMEILEVEEKIKQLFDRIRVREQSR